jgi:hypothetical protein
MNVISLNLERELNFERDGQIRAGKLVVSRLEYHEDRQAWACYWSLDFIKPSPEHCLWGRDPLESLASALCMAHELVRDSGIPNLQVWWKEKGDRGGLSNFVADRVLRESTAPPKMAKES